MSLVACGQDCYVNLDTIVSVRENGAGTGVIETVDGKSITIPDGKIWAVGHCSHIQLAFGGRTYLFARSAIVGIKFNATTLSIFLKGVGEVTLSATATKEDYFSLSDKLQALWV